jgi:hypothetical protein
MRAVASRLRFELAQALDLVKVNMTAMTVLRTAFAIWF